MQQLWHQARLAIVNRRMAEIQEQSRLTIEKLLPLEYLMENLFKPQAAGAQSFRELMAQGTPFDEDDFDRDLSIELEDLEERLRNLRAEFERPIELRGIRTEAEIMDNLNSLSERRAALEATINELQGDGTEILAQHQHLHEWLADIIQEQLDVEEELHEKRKQDLEDQLKGIGEVSRSLVTLIGDLKNMAEAFGDMSDQAENFIRNLVIGVEAATQLMSHMKQIEGIKFSDLNFSTQVDTVSSTIGVVSAVAGMAGSVMAAIKRADEKAQRQRDEALEQRKEAIQVSKENRKKLEESLEKLRNALVRGGDMTQAEAEQLGSQFAAYERARSQYLDAQGRGLGGDALDRLRWQMTEAMRGVNDLLESLGYDPESFRGLSGQDWINFVQPIVEDALQFGTFNDSVGGLIESIQFLNRFTGQDAVTSFQQFLDGMSEVEQIPEWMRTALSGMDLGTDEGKQMLRDLLGDWADQITRGDFVFGDLTSDQAKSIMDFLLGLTDTSASEGIQNLIGSIQRLGKFMEIDAVEALNRFMLGLGEIEDVPEWMRGAIAGLDLSTEEGRENLNNMLAQWAEQLTAGSLDLGGLSEGDFESVMDFLQGLSSGQFGDSDISTLSVKRSITDVQANAVVLLLEQLVFWVREMARKQGVTGEFSGSVFADDPAEKRESDYVGRVIREHIGTGGIGIVKNPDDVVKTHVAGAQRYKVDINGDIQLVVPLNPDSIDFADAAGQALATHLRRYNVRRT